MKKVFSALVLLFVLTTNAYAEHEGNEKQTYNSQKPVTCMTPSEMLTIVEKFSEVPYLRGQGLAAAIDGRQWIKTQVVVAINPETKTFTVVEFINQNLACVIAGGEDIELITLPELKTTVRKDS